MSTAVDAGAASFEARRHALIGLAYRMLGSRAEAEDVVQGAYLRWHAAEGAGVNEPRHYLRTVVARLCIDRLKSARARREIYVGPWLPEPAVNEAARMIAGYERRHRVTAPVIRAGLSWVFGRYYDGTDQARRWAAAQMPYIAFRPLR